MAITSVGYAGTVNEAEWADLVVRAGGSQYGVSGYADWRPTQGTGDRGLSIAAGKGWGWGVVDINSAPVNLTIPSVGSGSRWDLIVARRDWGTNTTSFQIVTGSTVKQLPTREEAPGSLDEQPIALVRVTAGQSTVQEIIDLRSWVADGGAFAVDELVLSYLNRIGTQVAIATNLWLRVLDVTGAPMWRKLDVSGDTGWIAFPGFTGGWLANPASPPKYRVKNGDLYLTGRITATANATNFPFALPLPVGFRPDVDTAVLCGETSGTGIQRVLQVGANGVVTVYKSGVSVSDLSLSGIRPMPVA